MKKMKGITLVELLVAMVVFSIIMTGVMNMIKPVQQGAADAKVANYQKNVEETVVTYIGEQLRYANNILIAEQGAKYTTSADTKDFTNASLSKGEHTISSPKDAATAFVSGMGIRNKYGEVMKPSSADNYQFVHMIIFDSQNQYKLDSAPTLYTGRMFAIPNGAETDGLKMGNGNGIYTQTSVTDFATSSKVFPLFGKGYFGTSDVYLRMEIDNTGMLWLKCYSDYYYNASGKQLNKLYQSDKNPTVGSFQIQNYPAKDNQQNAHMKFMVNDSHAANDAISCERSSKSGNIIYIVYTTDEDIDNIMNWDSKKSLAVDNSQCWYYNNWITVDGKEVRRSNREYNATDKPEATDLIQTNYKDAVKS